MKRLKKYIVKAAFVLTVSSILISGPSYAQLIRTSGGLNRDLNNRYRLAKKLENQGQTDQALEIYRFLFQRQPGNFTFYRSYVNILFRIKEYDELESAIDKFLFLHPKNEAAIVQLGELYYVKGDTSKAFRYWNESLRKFSQSISFYRFLFNGMIAHGLYDRAEKLLYEAREYYKRLDLFSLELANYYMARQEYIPAAREYLIYAKASQRNYKFATEQILRFPREEDIFVRLDSLILEEIANFSSDPNIHRLRSEVLFKFGRYNEAVNEVFIVESLLGNKGKEILNFAKDLLYEGEYEKAEEAYTELLQRKEFMRIAPNALLGLADATEQSVMKTQLVSPLTYLYPGNLFFNTDFVQGIGDNEQRLQKAFAIYDSVITALPKSAYSARALFRLAELRFRVTRDYDSAERLYQKACEVSHDRQLFSKCLVRLGDVRLAKGNPISAAEIFDQQAEKFEGSDTEKLLEVHKALALYLAGEVDSVLAMQNDLLGLLGPKHLLFNDVIEFINFIEENYSEADQQGKKAFYDFIKGELLIRQDKLSEAGQVYSFLIHHCPDEPVTNSARFRLAQIQLHFGSEEEAEESLDPIFTEEYAFADQVAFMMAEVAEYRDNSISEASRWYELILERYPDSLYLEIARKRLREFQKKTENAL